MQLSFPHFLPCNCVIQAHPFHLNIPFPLLFTAEARTYRRNILPFADSYNRRFATFDYNRTPTVPFSMFIPLRKRQIILINIHNKSRHPLRNPYRIGLKY